MSRVLTVAPLSGAEFAPFGDVIAAEGAADKLINQDRCRRYNDRARLDFTDGRAGISLFDADPRALPLSVPMLERHPDGSQCFVPMHANPWLVIVAPDAGGVPGQPRAFVAQPGQAVNLHRGTWHGVLTPLHAPGLFIVIDRIGDGQNLEEHWFDTPWRVESL